MMVLSASNTATDGFNLAREIQNVTPAKAISGSVVILLVIIRVGFSFFCNKVLQLHPYPGDDDQ